MVCTGPQSASLAVFGPDAAFAHAGDAVPAATQGLAEGEPLFESAPTEPPSNFQSIGSNTDATPQNVGESASGSAQETKGSGSIADVIDVIINSIGKGAAK